MGSVGVGVAVGVSVGVAVGVSVGTSTGATSVGSSATWAGVGVASGELSTTIGKLTMLEVGVSSGKMSSAGKVVASGEGVNGTLRLGSRTVTGVLVISGVPAGVSTTGGMASIGVGVVGPNSAI